jgi:hypothetical protein
MPSTGRKLELKPRHQWLRPPYSRLCRAKGYQTVCISNNKRLNLARDCNQPGVTPARWNYIRQYGKMASGRTKRSACQRFMKRKVAAVQRFFNKSMGKLSPERVNDQFQFGTMVLYVSCTVSRNVIIQYKPNKCKFSKLKFNF